MITIYKYACHKVLPAFAIHSFACKLEPFGSLVFHMSEKGVCLLFLRIEHISDACDLTVLSASIINPLVVIL
jgi:hypothetical protein